MDQILAIGLSHKTATVEVREKLHVSGGQVAAFLAGLRAAADLREVLLLATCNRVEVYAVASPGRAGAAEAALEAALAGRSAIAPADLAARLYRHRGLEAAAHAFRVAAGLDSMVLGESQILGQVKAAYLGARDAGFTGPLLNGLMERALRVGKRVRSETQIAALPVSVPSVAVSVARRVAADLTQSAVLLIGAGEMAELTARHLKKEGVRAIVVSNRHFDRAVALAAALGGRAARFDDLPAHLAAADVVIASAACPHPIIRAPDVERALRARGGRPLLLIDIAVPRNVDPGCRALEGVHLYDVDALGDVAAANGAARKREAVRAEAVIAGALEECAAWLRALAVAPAIVALRERVHALCEAELRECLPRLGAIPPDVQETVVALTRRIAKKLLHAPVTALREAAAAGRADLYAEVALALFGLDGRNGHGPGGSGGPPAAAPAESDARSRGCTAALPGGA